MAQLKEVLNIASAVRRFIEPVWQRWHQTSGHPVPQPASKYTCGRTSLFLRDVLRFEGHPAEWISGTPYAGGSRAAAPCGFYSGERWEGHAWVVSESLIIDITADQFGCGPIVVTSSSDARYVGSVDLADPAAIKARREAIAALWSEWTKYRSNVSSW